MRGIALEIGPPIHLVLGELDARHCRRGPQAAAGGAIALIEPGDTIEIDIPARQINVLLDEATLAERRDAMNHRARAWKPVDERPRQVSTALKVYASMVTSADKGAIRDSSLIDG